MLERTLDHRYGVFPMLRSRYPSAALLIHQRAWSTVETGTAEMPLVLHPVRHTER